MLLLIAQIGDTNPKLIRSLSMYIPPQADKASWLNLFDILPKFTLGLKSIVVRWWGEGLERFWEQGLGKDVAIARGLAGLSYAKPWPAYFRDKFRAGVVEAEAPTDDDSDWLRKDFLEYQIGTESLNPWEEEAG